MSDIGFTGAGLDRADHLRLDPDALAALAGRDDARLLVLSGTEPVLDAEGRLTWGPLPASPGELIFLGFEHGAPLFAPMVAIERPAHRSPALFRMLATMARRDAAIWGAVRHLHEFHHRHRFCGVCGAATAVFRGGWGRKCPNCGTETFPRVDPVVIMLAEHGNKVLIGRQSIFPARRYSALAGFVEPGESIEEAVARELAEEAGIVTTGVRYVASQPWPFPGQLMIACIATVESDALILDRKELEDAIWVDRSDVAEALSGAEGARFDPPFPYAIAHTLLSRWLAEAQPASLKVS